VENLTPETAQELKLPATTKGVVVNQVNPASRAAEAGLQPGDVIQQVNHQSVASVNEYNRALNASKKDQPVLLLVGRNGNSLFLAV
jgi:serine protease Do